MTALSPFGACRRYLAGWDDYDGEASFSDLLRPTLAVNLAGGVAALTAPGVDVLIDAAAILPSTALTARRLNTTRRADLTGWIAPMLVGWTLSRLAWLASTADVPHLVVDLTGAAVWLTAVIRLLPGLLPSSDARHSRRA